MQRGWHTILAAALACRKAVMHLRVGDHRRQALPGQPQVDIRLIQIKPQGRVKASNGQKCCTTKGAIGALGFHRARGRAGVSGGVVGQRVVKAKGIHLAGLPLIGNPVTAPDKAGGGHNLWVSKGSAQPRNPRRFRHGVIVDEGHNRSRCRGEAQVSCSRDIGLIKQNPLQRQTCGLGRSQALRIGHNDHLDLRMILLGQRHQTTPQRRRAVAADDDDAGRR